jgi:hypothetical protein
MHVWLCQNCPEDQEELLREGSCEYASYLILLDDKSDAGQLRLGRLLAKSDPVYGEGLRRIIEMVGQYGVDGWLDYLKDNSELPR